MSLIPIRPSATMVSVTGSGIEVVIAVIVPVKRPSPAKVTFVINAVGSEGETPASGSMPRIRNRSTPAPAKKNS